jgi:hypothetical protein
MEGAYRSESSGYDAEFVCFVQRRGGGSSAIC